MDKPLRVYLTKEQERLLEIGDVSISSNERYYRLPFIFKKDKRGNWFIVQIDRKNDINIKNNSNSFNNLFNIESNY